MKTIGKCHGQAVISETPWEGFLGEAGAVTCLLLLGASPPARPQGKQSPDLPAFAGSVDSVKQKSLPYLKREERDQLQQEILCDAKYSAQEREILHLKKKWLEKARSPLQRSVDLRTGASILVSGNRELQRRVSHISYLSFPSVET